MANTARRGQKQPPLSLEVITRLSARFTPSAKLAENFVDRERGELHLSFDNDVRLVLRTDGTWAIETA